MTLLYKRKGPDVLVNSETLNNQSGGHMALLPGGGFVAVWTDESVLGLAGIRAQRFDAAGNPIGSEFVVNSVEGDYEAGPRVETLASGRFVVTWTSEVPQTFPFQIDVLGQIFEADGTPVGDEFVVNTVTTAEQLNPQITGLANGGFVVVWTDLSVFEDPDDGRILTKAQRFDANGAKVGDEFLITGAGTGHSVLGLPGGGFAVAWNGGETKLQLFDAAGAPLGGVQTVSAADTGAFANIALNALGTGFIVTWAQQDSPQGFPPITHDVHAQRYDAAGNKLGAEILVNTTLAGSQTLNDAHELPGGGFIIVWQGPAEGTSDINIYGQIFAADDSRVGGEFIVTTTTADNQTVPRVEVLASGDIVITYTDLAGDDSGSGVRMQVLTLADDAAPTDIALSDMTISEVAVENLAVATLSATTGAINSQPVYTIVSDESGGAFRIDGDRLVVDDATRLDFETDPSVEVRIRVTDVNGASYEETVTLTIENSVTETRYSAGNSFVTNTVMPQYVNPIGSALLSSGGFVVLTACGIL